MNEKQYFDNINGYYVKDSDARDDLENVYTKSEVDSLLSEQAQAFNFTHFDTYDKDDFTIVSGCSALSSETSVTVAYNDDGSLCKIYGAIYPDGNATNISFNVTIQTALRPTSSFTIYPIGIVRKMYGDIEVTRSVWGTLNTSGVLTIYCTVTNDKDFGVYLWPCLYFVKDFGDTGGTD